MGKKRTNDANAVEKLVEESTPTKKVKKSEKLASNDLVKETVVELKKQRGRPKKLEVDQKIEEKPVEDIKEDRRGRSKKTTETKPIKQKVSRKKKVDPEIEKQESEKEEEKESDKEEQDLDKEEEKESEKEELDDDKIPVFDSEEESEESKQLELNNKLNSSLKKFDFEEFAGTKEAESCSEEENKETLDVVKEVETEQPKKSRSKKANTIEQKSPSKPASRTTRKTSNSEKSDQQVKSKSSPKATKTRKTSTTKKAKVTEKIDEESDPDEQPVELVEEKPNRQKRKTKSNQSEQAGKSSVVDNSKTTKAKPTKGKKSKPTEKPIQEEQEELSNKEESEDELKPTTSSKLDDADKMSKKSDKNPFKIISLNCAGVRAALKKGLVKFLNDEDPDIVCLQETKCTEDKMPEELKELGYHMYCSSSESKPNQSGVATLCKAKPINVTYGIGSEVHDTEGRAITCEFENFFVVNIYATNASRGLVNLDKKRNWNETFKNYLIDLDKTKPVIACGDFNCAHKEIDIKNPTANKKSAGFTPEEREDFTDLLDNGFFDSFRQLYPDKKDAYTFWSNMSNARSRNVGWRLDYYILSDRLQDALVDNIINDDQYFSDHCPITLLIDI